MEPGSYQLTMSVLMTPDKANFSGNVHGGALLKLLDEVAFACAKRYAGRYVVTPVGGSGDLPRADPCRRTGDLPRPVN